MRIWRRRAGLAALIVAALLTPLVAGAFKIRIISGLVGAQDADSKALLALPPARADEAARRDQHKPAGHSATPASSRLEDRS